MKIVTKQEGAQTLVRPYTPPLAPGGLLIVTGEPADDLLQHDRGKYRASIYLPDWTEIIQAIPRGHEINKYGMTKTFPITSYHAQALRKGDANDALPLSVSGLVFTDAGLIFGVRAGNVGNGTASVPAGHVSRSVLEAFYRELEEELGVGKPAKALIIGDQKNRMTNGINIVYAAETGEPFRYIQKRHAEAYRVYAEVKARCAGLPDNERMAREEIAGRGYPPDAWEHSVLFTVDPRDVKNALRTNSLPVGGKRYMLNGIARGAMILHEMHQLYQPIK
ncbi:MAG: NUDIX hydrolase [Candidatus Aenigmarchaeota archaeon]|nr:NUDIX hydrolase [Candidatus Aenigmarchaeota archaeon]